VAVWKSSSGWGAWLAIRLRFVPLAQARMGAGELRLRKTDRAAELSRDLFVGISLHVVEPHYGTRGGRERCERSFQIHLIGPSVGQRESQDLSGGASLADAGAVVLALRFVARRQAGAMPGGAQVHEAPGARALPHPCAERRLAAERAEPLEHGHH